VSFVLCALFFVVLALDLPPNAKVLVSRL